MLRRQVLTLGSLPGVDAARWRPAGPRSTSTLDAGQCRGSIVAGQQFMGDAHESAELLAIKRPGQAFAGFPLGEAQQKAMNQYTASVAIQSDLRLVALSAPRGNRFFIWELDSGKVRLDAPLADCAGVAAVADGFVVTSGQGRCRFYNCRENQPVATVLELPAGLWDNHFHVA